MGQGGVITVGDNATQAHHCTIASNEMDHLGLNGWQQRGRPLKQGAEGSV